MVLADTAPFHQFGCAASDGRDIQQQHSQKVQASGSSLGAATAAGAASATTFAGVDLADHVARVTVSPLPGDDFFTSIASIRRR